MISVKIRGLNFISVRTRGRVGIFINNKHMKLALLTVPYVTSDEHWNLLVGSRTSFDKANAGIKRVSDRFRLDVVIENKVDRDVTTISNVPNIVRSGADSLAAAWNGGLMTCFDLGMTHVLIPNLDVELRSDTVQNLIDDIKAYPQAGIWAATAINNYMEFIDWKKPLKRELVPVRVHDQSFSCFVISRECYELVGTFDEQFVPAYFEDCDYLRRCHLGGIVPMRSLSAVFWHFLQGTVKNSANTDVYNESLRINGQKYVNKHGGMPGEEKKTNL